MIASPCVGLCRLDPVAELCGGCARSGAEIAGWKDADAATRGRTWAALPARRERLGIGLHRLGWTPDETARFVAASLRSGRGSWTVGGEAGAARFAVGPAGRAAIDRVGGVVTAVTAQGAIRLAITDGVRVLALPGSPGDDGSPRGRLILAVPRGPTPPRPHDRLTPLGSDGAAIRPADRAGRLYDLGLGSAAACCCLRTADGGLVADLDRRSGRPWAGAQPPVGCGAAWVSACRVVFNAVGRVEEFSAGCGPPPGRGVVAAVAVPASLLLCAVFDPEPACEAWRDPELAGPPPWPNSPGFVPAAESFDR